MDGETGLAAARATQRRAQERRSRLQEERRPLEGERLPALHPLERGARTVEQERGASERSVVFT